jgi:Mg-chelatase subunit ChlD
VTLLHPVWLFLIIPLAVSLWLWPMPSRLLRVLRFVGLTLLVLAACGLALRLPSRAGTVVVVADRSESMPPGSETQMKEVIDLIQSTMSSEDRLAVVSFGQAVAVEQRPQTEKFAGFANEVGRDASNLAEAVETALSLIPRDAPGKVLVLSDGRWTGRDPALVASWAAARGVGIDYRHLQRPAASDLAVSRIDAPAHVAPGESFLITAWVQSPVPQTVNFELKRGDRVLASGERELTSGLNRLTFRDQATEAGNQSYTLNVTATGDDPVPENNTARLLVGVGGPKPLLHVATSSNSGMARLLQGGGIKLKLAQPEDCRWSLEELSKYSGVLIENVPAEKIGQNGMETLAAWVRETGAGLMMTGGRASYGPGGYYKSPLEPILPVSMELRNEHRKLSLAIVVVLDRSGSMAMPVSGGKVKMDLANLGTAAVLDLLGPGDEFGCIAVDTEPHTIADLAPVTAKEKVRKDILGIQSMGGGIFIDVALQAAGKMILPAKAGTKHIILFADAMDSEQPGKYQDLVKAAQSAGITISVIGLGTEKDKDAELLKDIARRGNGRVFFTDKPEELPRVFAQETFVVARNTFLDEPTPVRETAGLQLLTGKRYSLDKELGGYNLTYLRPEAKVAAVTLDEYGAPVVASWNAGAGRVLCYTGEADGEYTGAMARWKDVGDFYTSLVRWTVGESGPLSDGMLVTQEVKNGVNIVELHLDPRRQGDAFTALPKVNTLRAIPGAVPKVEKATLRWTGADTLAIEVPLQGSETALTTVEVEGQPPVALPPVCLPYSPEFKPVGNDTGLVALDKLARATGGKERVEVAGIWKELPRYPRLISLTPWLALAALVVLLLEVLERRMGVLSQVQRFSWDREKTPATARRRWFGRKPSTAALPASKVIPMDAAPAAQAPRPLPNAEEKADVLDALRQARQRLRGRTE